MKNYKFLLTIFICFVIITPSQVLAHPGRTNSSGCHKCNGDNTNCAKWGLANGEYHCHSGNTYKNSKGEVYDKSGTKISGSSSSNSTSTIKKPSNSNSGTTNNSTFATKPQTSTTKPTTPKPVEKSKDTSLKIVTVDGNEISIEDQMKYETNKKNIELNIEATDGEAKVEFNNSELTIGENEIVIKVTAEAGNVKEYKLIVTKKEITSDVVITNFVLGTSEVEFTDNKATIEKLTTESSFEYSYELSDKNAKLLLYVNNQETTELNNIKNGDIIKLVVIDTDDNKNIYEIKVQEISGVESFIINLIAYTIVGMMFLSPVIIIVILLFIKK